MYCNIVFMIDIFVISKITQYRYYVIAITDVRSLGLSTKWRTLMIKKTMKVRENTFRKLEDPFENGAAKKYVFYVKVDDVAEGIPMATNPRDQKLTSGVATAIKESLLSNDGYFHLKNRGIVLSAESVHYNNKEKIATIIFSDELSHGNIDGGHTYKIVCEHKGENLEQYVQFEVMTGVEDIIENLAEARNTSVQVDAKSMAELAEKFDPIRKLAAYVILGINAEGKKEVLTISIGENESSKYWLSVLNELKNRGVKDILIICADGLTGIKEAIAAAFPKTEYQRCIVHQVRNTLKYVPDKDRKAFATDLKTIYQAADEKKALAALDRVMEKWTAKYPNSMKRWKDNWDAISPIFKFSAAVRKVIYTTNAIESLNSTYRKLNRQRSVFPSDTALLKALYLATFEATKKWTATIRNWAQVYGELSIMYEGRLPE